MMVILVTVIKPKTVEIFNIGKFITVGNINGKSDIIIVGDAGRHGGTKLSIKDKKIGS